MEWKDEASYLAAAKKNWEESNARLPGFAQRSWEEAEAEAKKYAIDKGYYKQWASSKDRDEVRKRTAGQTAPWGQISAQLRAGSAQAASDRKRNLGALDMLQRLASGQQQSIAEQVADRKLEQGQAAIASRLASMPGGYNPAAQRQALSATRDLAQQVAGDAEVNAAKEQLALQKLYSDAALRNYLAGLQGEGQRGKLGLAALSAGSGENIGLAQILAALYGGDQNRATQLQLAQMQQPSLGDRLLQGGLGLVTGLAPLAAKAS